MSAVATVATTEIAMNPTQGSVTLEEISCRQGAYRGSNSDQCSDGALSKIKPASTCCEVGYAKDNEYANNGSRNATEKLSHNQPAEVCGECIDDANKTSGLFFTMSNI